VKAVLLRGDTRGSTDDTLTDSELAQFLTFVGLSAGRYSNFGGSTVPLDAKYLLMSDHRTVPTNTDGGNCMYQLHLRRETIQYTAHILNLCLVRFGTDSDYNVSPMKRASCKPSASVRGCAVR
jgi:hypothetical protein